MDAAYPQPSHRGGANRDAASCSSQKSTMTQRSSASMLCCRTESTRLRCRCAGFWVLFASHVDEEQTGSRKDGLLQSDSAEYVATFIVDRELCWEAQAAGKLPASIVVASHYSKMIYDMRSGGGGNCNRVPRSACRRPELDHRSWGEHRLCIEDCQIPVQKHSAAVT
jgi:hypothetical protein